MPNELLRPSLNQDSPVHPLYSMNSMFLVAFFGGPFAIMPYSLLNLWRMQRLKKDFWLPLVGFLAYILFLLVTFRYPRAYTFHMRLIGLAYLGCFYWRYRSVIRTADIHDEKAPSPWVPALLSILAGLSLSILFRLLKWVAA